MRHLLRPIVVAAALLLLPGCGAGAGAPVEPTPSSSPDVGALTIDQLGTALPADADLPDTASEIERCPAASDDAGAELCAGVDPDREASLSAMLGENEGMFFRPGLQVWIRTDVDVPMEVTVEATRKERAGDFRIEGEETESGVTPDEKGTGNVEEAAVGEWSGYVQSSTSTSSFPGENDWSTPQSQGLVVLGNEDLRVSCSIVGVKGQAPDDAVARCRSLVDDVVARIDELAAGA
ncbi:hypothetical protein AAG589_14495 [Isoptericola sp. F-RaC21]|uniref:hypothetical protein n=1 Tax=Isoptericola sp. F-RaC21 TaxID=3141452 RepID=UPI00315B6648